MGLRTMSQFYYGHEVDKTQHFISIDEGSGELTVNLTPSGYTFTELGQELQRALNEAGVLTYTVTVDRSARKYTITASAPFDILAGTGLFFGSLLYSALGFNSFDKTGLSTYTSDNATGKVWRPQVPLFNYSPSIFNESSLQARQDESGNGNVEVITFGTINQMSFSLKYITDRLDRPEFMELNRTATTDTMAFLSYIRKKNRVEFMQDRDTPTDFEKFILDKTGASSTGLEVRLTEMASVQDYYEFSTLTFRKVT